MAEINEKDFISELIFCINQSDVVKAKALVQFFAEVNPKTQNRVLYELSKSPDEIAFPVLDYLLDIKSGEDKINEKIHDLILEIAYGNPKVVIERVERKDFKNKISYINIAGDLKMKEAIPALVESLRFSTDIAEAEATIRALGAIGVEECVPALLNFLKSEDVVLKTAGISALSEIGSSSAIEQLTRAVSGDNRTDQSIIDGLSKIQNQHSMDKLSGLLASSYANIRSMVIENLIKIGPKAVPSLVEKLKADDTDLQVHALTILGKIGDKTAAPAIQKLLFDKPEDSNVRFGAYEALGRLPSSKTAISLASGLEDPDEQVRLAAAKAIDSNLNNVLVAGLKNLIKSGDEDSKKIVATFMDSEADNVVDTLVDWDVFPDLAADYLATKADPDTKDHFMVMLKAKGKTNIIEKMTQASTTDQEDNKLLIYAVDDSNMMLKLYMKKFHAMGHKTVAFQFPAEAIKAIKKTKPDLLVTDLNMPEINGLQLTTEIRRTYDTKKLPIIMITTQSDFVGRSQKKSSQRVTKESIVEAGVNRILHKPFSDNDLTSAIKEVLE